MKVRDRILVITDLMLGALYADATMTGDEDRAVRELLSKLLLCTPATLPAHVDQRIREFSLMTFDIELASKDFLSDPPMKKRRLLELMAALTDKDGTDFREDEYLRDLAQCLGMESAEYQDLVLNYEIGSLRQSFESLRISDHFPLDEQAKPADPEAELPRWRRKALRERRESQKKLEAQRAAEQAKAATASKVPKTVPPPIPEAARSKKKI